MVLCSLRLWSCTDSEEVNLNYVDQVLPQRQRVGTESNYRWHLSCNAIKVNAGFRLTKKNMLYPPRLCPLAIRRWSPEPPPPAHPSVACRRVGEAEGGRHRGDGGMGLRGRCSGMGRRGWTQPPNLWQCSACAYFRTTAQP
jgi:hypothetical protein